MARQAAATASYAFHKPDKVDDFQSFEEFFPFYLYEHCERTNRYVLQRPSSKRSLCLSEALSRTDRGAAVTRRLHVIGTLLSVVLFCFFVSSGRYWELWKCPTVGYAFAWVCLHSSVRLGPGAYSALLRGMDWNWPWNARPCQ